MNGAGFPGDCPDFRLSPRSGAPKMGLSPLAADQLRALADMACDGVLREDDAAQLERLLHGNLEAQRFYLTHLSFDRRLRWVLTHEVATPTAPPSSPLVLSLDGAVYGTVGFFSSGWPVAYLIATVIFGIGLLIGSHVYMSGPEQLVRQSTPPPSPAGRGVGGEGSGNLASSLPSVVGRIIGTANCRWARDSVSLLDGDAVPLDVQLKLDSGLVAVQYNTGAKVILQGPACYVAESRNGGFLAIGKVTGKVEVEKAKGFFVRTPTATVTDLGTEFGVEVSKEGHTTSHVYRGSVRLQVASSDGKTVGTTRILHENESARVEEMTGEQGGGNRVTVFVAPAKLTTFVREIPKRAIKVLDLVDVVAGGDGFSGRRNRGVDVITGLTTNATPKGFVVHSTGDGRYHRVRGVSFVDGVFVPNGRSGPMPVSSTGLVCADLPVTSGETTYPIWAGGAIPPLSPNMAINSTLGGVDFSSQGHRLLFCQSNVGITFDLEAIRRANPACSLLRFCAVVGNTEQVSQEGAEAVYADVWVLVDGKVGFRRREISGLNGAFSVLVDLEEKDRLTLAATDGGNGIACDWILFGDPRLELVDTVGAPVRSEQPNASTPSKNNQLERPAKAAGAPTVN